VIVEVKEHRLSRFQCWEILEHKAIGDVRKSIQS